MAGLRRLFRQFPRPYGVPSHLFPGTSGMIHELVHHRPNSNRFHVHGYVEEGCTTSPFDMLVLNGMSRHHLAIAALHRMTRFRSRAGGVIAKFQKRLAVHRIYIREHGVDLPEIVDWRWSPVSRWPWIRRDRSDNRRRHLILRHGQEG